MSNSTHAPALQLHINSAGNDPRARTVLDAVLDQDCVLCSVAARGLVCAACESTLAQPRARCRICAIALPAQGTCGDCLTRPPEFQSALAAYDYRFPLDRLVQRFKYGGDLAIGRWLGERLAAFAASADRPQLVVAPPSARDRLRERGFNPALEIAKVVAKRLALPCAVDAVSRTRATAPQPGLGRNARRHNLEAAFACRSRLAGHVAIVDDVMTTGATADALATVLRRAGAARVSVWVVARTPEPRG